MDTITARRTPGWYLLVAILGLLWEAFGCFIFTMIAIGDDRGDYALLPSWVFIVFGVAVFSGLAGALGLVLRQRWATIALIVSLLAAIVQYGYVMMTAGLNPSAIPMVAAVIGIGLLLVIVASAAGSRGWLR
jgi:predicted permease